MRLSSQGDENLVETRHSICIQVKKLKEQEMKPGSFFNRNLAVRNLTFIILFLGASSISFSQKKFLTKDLQVENDNDAYTLNLMRDQYYKPRCSHSL